METPESIRASDSRGMSVVHRPVGHLPTHLQNPINVIKGTNLHPKDHRIQIFTDASNKGTGAVTVTGQAR